MNVRKSIEDAIAEAKVACGTEVIVQSLTIQLRETLDCFGNSTVRAEAIDVTIVPMRCLTAVFPPVV